MTVTLVTGATGNVGHRVVRELRAVGSGVRALVRDPDRAAALLGSYADTAVGDFADPSSLDVALKGADQVFLACSNHPRQFEFESNVIDAASRAGVRRIVKLSALGAMAGSPLAFWDCQARIEEHLALSGVPTIVLQPTFYMSNLLASAGSIKHARKFFLPAGPAPVAMIDPADVAAVGAAVLGDAGADGLTYRLTGPAAITFADVAEGLSEATGSTIDLVVVPDADARAAMVGSGMPEWVADNLVTLFGYLGAGSQDTVTTDVLDVTGHPPKPFAHFAHENAALFMPA